MIDEKQIETVKFKTYAEKADTEEKRIELCRKYLQHKGMIVIVNTAKPDFTPKLQDTKGIHRVCARQAVDMYVIEQVGPEFYNQMRQNCVRLLSEELLKAKLIHFDDRKDFGDDKFVTTATLLVWKDPKNA